MALEDDTPVVGIPSEQLDTQNIMIRAYSAHTTYIDLAGQSATTADARSDDSIRSRDRSIRPYWTQSAHRVVRADHMTDQAVRSKLQPTHDRRLAGQSEQRIHNNMRLRSITVSKLRKNYITRLLILTNQDIEKQ